MKKQLLVFSILTFLTGSDETTSISSEIKTDVPHQFKDPYIKMLDQCGD
jgi:hypothetical protein